EMYERIASGAAGPSATRLALHQHLVGLAETLAVQLRGDSLLLLLQRLVATQLLLMWDVVIPPGGESARTRRVHGQVNLVDPGLLQHVEGLHELLFGLAREADDD